ncbi:mCG145280, partial [Mus musculus]
NGGLVLGWGPRRGSAAQPQPRRLLVTPVPTLSLNFIFLKNLQFKLSRWREQLQKDVFIVSAVHLCDMGLHIMLQQKQVQEKT